MPNSYVEDYEQIFGKKPEASEPDVISTKVVEPPAPPGPVPSGVQVETK